MSLEEARRRTGETTTALVVMVTVCAGARGSPVLADSLPLRRTWLANAEQHVHVRWCVHGNTPAHVTCGDYRPKVRLLRAQILVRFGRSLVSTIRATVTSSH